MNEHDDKALDDYLAGGTALSARYREAGDEGPSPELDAVVLGRARAAIDGDAAHAGASRRRSWFVPMSTAAVVVLAAALVLEITLPGSRETGRDPMTASDAGSPPAPELPSPATSLPAPSPAFDDADVRTADRPRVAFAPPAAPAAPGDTDVSTSQRALAQMKRDAEATRALEQRLGRTEEASGRLDREFVDSATEAVVAEVRRGGRAEADGDGSFAGPPPAAPDATAAEPWLENENGLAADRARAAMLSHEAPSLAAVPQAPAARGLVADGAPQVGLGDAQLQALALARIAGLAREGDDEEAARLLDEVLERWPDLVLPDGFPVPDPREAD